MWRYIFKNEHFWFLPRFLQIIKVFWSAHFLFVSIKVCRSWINLSKFSHAWHGKVLNDFLLKIEFPTNICNHLPSEQFRERTVKFWESVRKLLYILQREVDDSTRKIWTGKNYAFQKELHQLFNFIFPL